MREKAGEIAIEVFFPPTNHEATRRSHSKAAPTCCDGASSCFSFLDPDPSLDQARRSEAKQKPRRHTGATETLFAFHAHASL